MSSNKKSNVECIDLTVSSSEDEGDETEEEVSSDTDEDEEDDQPVPRPQHRATTMRVTEDDEDDPEPNVISPSPKSPPPLTMTNKRLVSPLNHPSPLLSSPQPRQIDTPTAALLRDYDYNRRSSILDSLCASPTMDRPARSAIQSARLANNRSRGYNNPLFTFNY